MSKICNLIEPQFSSLFLDSSADGLYYTYYSKYRAGGRLSEGVVCIGALIKGGSSEGVVAIHRDIFARK